MIRQRLRRVLSPGEWPEAQRIATLLRTETVGGLLLVAAAIVAIVLANSPAADAYTALRDTRVGPEALHLNLSLGSWAADGLLAVFFFLVGLELKREFVAGDLREPRRALVPVAAAAGGVLLPALIYVAFNATRPDALGGWAIPTATDIAFAVAVLAVIGSHLPSALRIFLLTLAVVDDLIAIMIIAVVYTNEIHVPEMLATVVPVAVFAYLVQRFRRFFARSRWAAWVILLPLAIVAWALLHASGIHATIAGVVLGFCVPVRGGAGPHGLAGELENHLRPLSAGVAVPVFAFFSAGVTIGGWQGLMASLSDTVTLGIIAGLVLGKPIGIVATTWAVTTFTGAELDDDVRWADLAGVGLLAGIGFTVSLLIAELSFGVGTPGGDHAKVGILLASTLAALAASVVLGARNRRYRQIARRHLQDADGDGVPDVYQR